MKTTNEKKLKYMVLLLMEAIRSDSLDDESEAMSKAYDLLDEIKDV